MKKIKFTNIPVYGDFLQDFGKQFKYLHVDFCGEDGWWLVLTTETFSSYFFECNIDNSYEVGLYSNAQYDIDSLRSILGEGVFNRFYEVDYE